MHIKNLLDKKGRNTVTVGASETLATVFTTLAQHRIGVLVVCDDDERVQGIISERDLVRVVAKDGERVLAWPVDAVMTKDVITCHEDETVNSVMEKMTTGRFRHMPVTEKGRLVGVISIGDMVKAHIEAVEKEAAEIKAYIHSY